MAEKQWGAKEINKIWDNFRFYLNTIWDKINFYFKLSQRVYKQIGGLSQ